MKKHFQQFIIFHFAVYNSLKCTTVKHAMLMKTTENLFLVWISMQNIVYGNAN